MTYFTQYIILFFIIIEKNSNKPEDVGKPEAIAINASENGNQAEDMGKPEDAGKPENKGKPELVGLEMALTKVKNENARARLQANIKKIQARIAEKLNMSEDVEVEIDEVDEESGDVVVKAKEPVKYLGFIKGKATKRYSVNAEGAIEEKAPWYRFLYAEY